jgi:hypothetical protein
MQRIMSRKTIILREDQFNEICGVNTAYLDNSSDYTEDGLTKTKAGGAVSNGEGQKEYSEPMTTDDYAHELAPETLFALLFRNGGHGLWGHWGSGLRAKELTESDKKKLQESNSELEGRTWNGDSYTNLTTKKTELKKMLNALVQQNAPKQQIQRVKSALAGVCAILDRETGAIKQRKTTRKNLGFENQFQKAGGKKNSGNGKAHTKKTKDPNVGTGYITYA